MSREDFRREFVESKYGEFKTGIGRGQIESSAAAFMNAEGGLVFVGVADDGTVRGRSLDAGTQDDIHQRMRTPVGGGRYAIDAFDVDGTEVVVVRIWAARGGIRADLGRSRTAALFLRHDHHLEIGRTTIEVLRFPADQGHDYDLRRTFEGSVDRNQATRGSSAPSSWPGP